MNPSTLAHRPLDLDIPGDIYREVPPWPRIKWLDSLKIENVARAMLPHNADSTYDLSCFEWMPGTSGVMQNAGNCMGVDANHSVWRFGFGKASRMADAFGCTIPDFPELDEYGFLWVIARRQGGKIMQTWRGWANEMPKNYRDICDAPVILSCPPGSLSRPIFYSPRTNVIARKARVEHLLKNN